MAIFSINSSSEITDDPSPMEEETKMARYKRYDYDQIKLLPVSFHKQIQPGTFEFTLSYLIDNKVDMSVFEEFYCNDETGAPAYSPSILLRMKEEIDLDQGRAIYSKRIGTVEPVFANMRHVLRLNRFTLRGKIKVNIQWKLFSIVHNMLKIHRFGLIFDNG
jgi:hypothetical protein